MNAAGLDQIYCSLSPLGLNSCFGAWLESVTFHTICGGLTLLKSSVSSTLFSQAVCPFECQLLDDVVDVDVDLYLAINENARLSVYNFFKTI